MSKKYVSKSRKKQHPMINFGIGIETNRIDTIAMYILFTGMILTCITVIAIETSYIGPMRINGLDGGGVLGTLNFDFFAQGKLVVLAATASLLLISLVYKIMAHNYTISLCAANIPVTFLALLVAISCITSNYPAVALMGVPDIYFGTVPFMLLLLVFFVALNLSHNNSFLRNLIISLAIITIVNVIISFGHTLGVQWYQAPIVGSLILPADIASSITIKGNIQSTFNNPNYSSGLFGSLTVFFLALAATVSNRQLIVVFLGLAVTSLSVSVISLSTSGFATISLMFPLALVLFLLNRENRTFRLTIMATALVFCLISGWYASTQSPQIYSSTAGWVGKFCDALFKHDIKSDNDHQGDTPDNIVGDSTSNTDKFTIELPTTSNWDSSRLFLATETWKLVKERPLIGYGMDTLVYYFPSNSRETIAVLGLRQIVTKPHNMYLQLAVGAGIPALLAFLALVGMYVFLTAKSIIMGFRESGEIPPLQTALLLFVMAFLIQGLVNDWTIGTAMCFFVMLGLGYSMLNDSKLIQETSLSKLKQDPK